MIFERVYTTILIPLRLMQNIPLTVWCFKLLCFIHHMSVVLERWRFFLQQTLQNLGSFKLSSFRKKIKKLQDRINNIFQTCRIFSWGSERVKWQKNSTGHGAVLLRPNSFQTVAFWIASGLPKKFMYSWPLVCSIPTCAKFDLRRIFGTVAVV